MRDKSQLICTTGNELPCGPHMKVFERRPRHPPSVKHPPPPRVIDKLSHPEPPPRSQSTARMGRLPCPEGLCFSPNQKIEIYFYRRQVRTQVLRVFWGLTKVVTIEIFHQQSSSDAF